jgi:hypothetical protein
MLTQKELGMNISTLEAYVEQKNSWGKIFGSKPLSLLNAADRQRIAENLEGDLSPENLTCDGELPRSQVQARYRQLTRALQELRSIDPKVKLFEDY